MRGCRAFKRPLAIAGFSRKKTVKEEFSGPKPRCRKEDRKSTRLNSSHSQISYAVFCLKKKKSEPQSYRTARKHPPAAGVLHCPPPSPSPSYAHGKIPQSSSAGNSPSRAPLTDPAPPT